MMPTQLRAFIWLLVGGFCLLAPQSVYAVALAESNLSFSNLQIVPASGTVVLTPWGLEAFAEARNSLGELDQDYASSTSPDQVQADAAVTWANAQGDASALADPPDLNVTANANSTVDIPDHIKMAWAASDGRGSLSNLFTITGGTGSVEVDFSVDIAGSLHVLTTNNGILAETETIFTLAVINLITGDLELLLSNDDPDKPPLPHLLVGPNSKDDLSISETLTATPTLEFSTPGLEVPYFLYIEVDSESFGVVPEPPVLALMSLGVGILVVSARKNRETLRAN